MNTVALETTLSILSIVDFPKLQYKKKVYTFLERIVSSMDRNVFILDEMVSITEIICVIWSTASGKVVRKTRPNAPLLLHANRIK